MPPGTTLDGLREIAYQHDVGIDGEVAKASPLDDGQEVSTALFRLLDQDGDGKLAKAEFVTAWGGIMAQAAKAGTATKMAPEDVFATMDVDGDGAVNSTEASIVLATMLEAASSGAKDAKERREEKEANAKKFKEPPAGFEPAKAKKELAGMAEQLFRLLDTNFDQTLDRAEIQMLEELGSTSGAGKMPLSPDIMFSQMDADNDGLVNRDEAAELFKILGDSLGF